MKKLLLLGFVIILTAPVFSQIKFGIKAGGETTTVPSYQLGNGAATINALKDASWGYHAGIFLRFGLGPVYLQPEAVFASTSFDYNVTTVNMTALRTQKFNRISIPVLLGLKLGPLRINAGPAASVMIGSPSALINDPDFENMYRRTVYGYQAGLGIDLGPLTLDVRYAGSLGEKYGNSVNIGGQTFKLDYGQSSLLLSVGLMF
ncbi:MAG: outer membrane beta-barrel protein [Bacteroidales bacterium]|nr:outer membrane beta-barrel protein [Bacteroidales bacterium]